MASFVYRTGLARMMAKHCDVTSDTLKVCLVTAAPSQDTNITTAYPTGITELAAGNGYTTGGANLAGTRTVVYGSTYAQMQTDADTTWTTASFSGVVGAVIYDASDSNYCLAYVDFGGTKAAQGGDFTIQFSTATNGVFYLS